MVIFITGASRTGKTNLAQKLLEKYQYPYLSLDHLKMGLIRSGNTDLTPMSSISELTDHLWPIVVGIAKTAIENNQNLIIEGCYIPSDWYQYFDERYLRNIRCYCLIMSEGYIHNHFSDIRSYANVIENRIVDSVTIDSLLAENAHYLGFQEDLHTDCLVIHDEYAPDIVL